MWQPVSSAPFDRDLELPVIDKGEVHALVLIPGDGWMKAETKKQIEILSHALARVDELAHLACCRFG